MARVVFILGAGASKCVGAPLMLDFLDKAEGLRRTDRVGDYKQQFDLVFKGLSALQQVHAKTQIDQDNLEAVFAAFEMAKLLGRFGRLEDREISDLPAAMRRVIEVTLQKTIQARVTAVDSNGGNSDIVLSEYDAFGQKLAHLKRQSYSISIITFNYDLCLDYILQKHNLGVDYGFDAGVTSGIKLLKLHGSLNWGRCSECDEIRIGPVFDTMQKSLASRKPNDLVTFEPVVEANKLCSSHKRPMDLVLVPPTWSKAEHHREVQQVWRSAALELKEAEYIAVCGYSLPESDYFFRYLLALGTMGDSRLKSFVVCDPSRAVESRCKNLLGPLAEKRFQFFDRNFTDFPSIAESVIMRQ